MTYDNFISQFEILDNPPKKKGFHRHHIVPVSEQTEPDNRQIYLLPSQHLWAHLLYDQENGTNTASMLIGRVGIRKENIHSYEDCLCLDSIPWNSDESIRKGKEANIGKHHTEEHKKKISESNKGKHHTEEAKEKIRQANLGKHFSEETLAKMTDFQRSRTDNKMPVQQFTKDGQFVKEFPSISEAARRTGLSGSGISACCSGKYHRKSLGNSVWKYAS